MSDSNTTPITASHTEPAYPADDIRVAIVGGGIGGRTVLKFLRAAGLSNVVLYEQAPSIAEVGAGIQLSPNAVRLLARLGLGEELSGIGIQLKTGWEMRRWADGHKLVGQPGQTWEHVFGVPYYVAHRADLLRLLGAGRPDPMVRMGVRCIGMDQGGDEVDLRFDNGTAAHADVVIGADGVHSVVQQAVTEPGPPTFAHLAAYRGLVPADRAPELARRPVSTMWLGPGRHLVHYPVWGGRLVNVVGVIAHKEWGSESWSIPGRVADFAEQFADWDDRVIQLIAALPSTSLHALHDREPLDHWVNGRICLLGDAAHAMLPTMAQGAAQAIEDAAVLSHCLGTATRDTVDEALRSYQALRKDRATRIQQLSRRRAEEYHLPDGELQRQRDQDLAGGNQLSRYSWLWGYDAESPAELLV